MTKPDTKLTHKAISSNTIDIFVKTNSFGGLYLFKFGVITFFISHLILNISLKSHSPVLHGKHMSSLGGKKNIPKNVPTFYIQQMFVINKIQ